MESVSFKCFPTEDGKLNPESKGSVTLRWYGESNGYYSESVNFHQLETVH